MFEMEIVGQNAAELARKHALRAEVGPAGLGAQL